MINDLSKEYFDLIKIGRTFTRHNLGTLINEIERREDTKQNWFLFEKK